MSQGSIPGREEFSLLQWTSTEDEILATKDKLRRKKKVRLKRSTRGKGSSKSSKPYCGLTESPMYLCWFEDLSGLRLNLVLVSFLFIVILLVAFAVHLHSQIYNIQISVMEERKLANDNHHRYHTQIQELIANQTMLTNNITLLYQLFHNYSSQMTKLDSSLSSLMSNINSAPELKSLPKDIQDAKKNLAKFGSHLTNLDTRVSELETKLAHDVVEMTQNLNSTLHKRDEDYYASVIQKVVHEKVQPLKEDIKHLDQYQRIFATNITEQLKGQELNFAQNLKIVNKLEDNMKNVTQAYQKNKEQFRHILQQLQENDIATRGP